jgi:hypothetical protein
MGTRVRGLSIREGPLMYKVATDKGQIWRRHTEQLKATKMEQTREAPNIDDCIVVPRGLLFLIRCSHTVLFMHNYISVTSLFGGFLSRLGLRRGVVSGTLCFGEQVFSVIDVECSSPTLLEVTRKKLVKCDRKRNIDNSK